MNRIGVLLFPEFELLDVFGPLEMFGMLDEHFTIRVVAERERTIASAQGPHWVESGRFFTSSGVSAGIDMSLALIARIVDETTARQAAHWAEYSWQRDPDGDPFAVV